jgi:hypothetical protein
MKIKWLFHYNSHTNCKMSILNQFQYATDRTAFMHTVWHYTVPFHLNSYCKHNKDDRVKHMQDVKDESNRQNEEEK